ncbi:MAG: hypothetical protein ACE5G9_06300 [Nitrospinales bacterium]
MKKSILTALVTLVALCFVASAFAGTVAPGQQTTCNDAKSITLTASGSDAKDRSNANATVWKSSNFTTVPITLGPTEHNSLEGDGGVGMSDKHTMGRKSVTLVHQPNFSRGDSIGDISGEVRITNTGSVNLDIVCN